MGEVWKEFCRREKTPAGETWLAEVLKYERDVLAAR
jgi:L-rhamnose isomerase